MPPRDVQAVGPGGTGAQMTHALGHGAGRRGHAAGGGRGGGLMQGCEGGVAVARASQLIQAAQGQGPTWGPVPGAGTGASVVPE